MLFFNNINLNEKDIVLFLKEILHKHNIFAIPSIDFSFSKETDLGIRVNLLKKDSNISTYLDDLSSFNFNSFNIT